MFGRKKKVIRAQQFVLEDEQGKERAKLMRDEAENSVLYFLDDEEKVRMFLGLTKAGTPRMALQYAEGKGSIQLEANDAIDAAAMTFVGPGGKIQLFIGLSRNGSPAVALFDEQGNLLYTTGDLSFTPGKSDDEGESFDWDSILKRD